MARNDPLMKAGTRRTPQSEQADPRQARNNAGGFAFTIPAEAQLHRFLTIGTEGGTYYVKERELTRQNAALVQELAKSDASLVVSAAREISVAGRAPRNNPALFALAAASKLGNDEGRHAAFNALSDIARTGTHLYTWARYRELFGGWGRGARRAVAEWYLTKDTDRLAYQMVKYRQRDGWTHRDLLRLSHPLTADASYRALFDFACKRDGEALPQIVQAFEKAQSIERGDLTGAKKAQEWVKLIGDSRLPWEALPDRALTMPSVWRALLEAGMPMTALLRKLPVLTNLEVLQPLSEHLRLVCGQLTDQERLVKSRVHPVSILIAMKTYAQGRSMRGDSRWVPVPQVTDALNDAFYLAFGAVEPSGKRTMLALDVSGSMGSAVAGIPGLSCREASAALALVTAATEKDYAITGFTSGSGPSRWGPSRWGAGMSLLSISPKQRLDDVVRSISRLSFGGTDCSLPMRWALQTKTEVDTFQVYTDNETWHGDIHPFQALREYREKMGIPARLAVVAMTPTEFSIADPRDPGSLDVSGFDSAVPILLSDFSRGDI